MRSSKRAKATSALRCVALRCVALRRVELDQAALVAQSEKWGEPMGRYLRQRYRQ
jgi:hypothetical protein